MQSVLSKLRSSVNDEVRKKLEGQFEMLLQRTSMAHRFLAKHEDIIESPTVFKDYHYHILDKEFLHAFGISQAVIVYSYKTQSPEFGSIYVPKGMDEASKNFMKDSTNDLKRIYIDNEGGQKGEEGRKHLFMSIIKIIEAKKEKSRFQHYSTFIPEIKDGAIDKDTGITIHVSPQGEEKHKDMMLLATPLYLEESTFLVMLASYIHKQKSLFAQIQKNQLETILDWYYIVNETISQCILPVAHLLRLRERMIQQETLERISVISHILSHASVKLFSTPLKNIVDDLRRLDVHFIEDTMLQKNRFDRSLRSIDMIADLWEGNFVILEEFGAIEHEIEREQYKFYCPQMLSRHWKKIEDVLIDCAQVLFYNHINDLYDDPEYNDFLDLIFKQVLTFHDFFILKSKLKPNAICYGHPKLIALHLVNFLENSIEAADLTRAAESYRKYKQISEDDKYTISFYFSSENTSPYRTLVAENNCPVREEENIILGKIGKYIDLISENQIGAANLRRAFEKRIFTTKSGPGLGRALLLAADYFRRITVINEYDEGERSGKMSLVFPTQYDKFGVKIMIKLPTEQNQWDDAFVSSYSASN